MSNKQQTAVEWFHQKTWALKIQLEKGEISIGKYANTYATLYDQAKEMEKEQSEKYANYVLELFEIKTNPMSFNLWNETYGGNK
jgi:hypothetical protein